MDFAHSPRAEEMIQRARAFIEREIRPIEEQYHHELQSLDDSWVVLPVVEELKEKARTEGLWNLFLPDEDLGGGLSVTEYAPIAELTGASLLAPEVFNCNAPDTGNMEVLYHYGSDR
jgi:acyl-CoA dehydrogenase